MTDVAINAFASLSTNISDSVLQSDDNGSLLFKETADYHPSCNIKWGDHDSEMKWSVYARSAINHHAHSCGC